MNFSNQSVMVLNADNMPLNLISWKRAIVLLLKNKATIVETYNVQIRDNIKMPKIIKLFKFIKYIYKQTSVPFSCNNILLRDFYKCAYCNRIFKKSELTIDHIIPKSRNGTSTFENCITACKECNIKKANKTPEEAGMKLYYKPKKPTKFMLVMNMFKLNRKEKKI